jgi:hypothetical protein
VSASTSWHMREEPREVGAKLGYSAFDEIRGRVKVITYDELSEAHTKSAEAAMAMARVGL